MSLPEQPRSSIVVTGCGAAGRAAAAAIAGVPVTQGSVPDDVGAGAVVLIAATPEAHDEVRAVARQGRAAGALTVVVTPPPATETERQGLGRLRGVADATVVAPPPAGVTDAPETLAAGVRAFVALVSEAGLVNVDLADLHTVLAGTGAAALCRGRGPSGERAVASALAPLDGLSETTGVLVHVAGGSSMSVASAGEAIEAVGDRVPRDAHLIWGAAIDDELAGELRVRLVVAGVSPGGEDACPRCGSAMETYEFGGKTTRACDGCGYAGVGVGR